MIYTLPSLHYAYDALEPYIDAKTMELHHDKHHQSYITNLNEALHQYPAIAELPLRELLEDLTLVPEPIRAAVRNNGGGHLNHTEFWRWMIAPQLTSGGAVPMPRGTLAIAIDARFGSFSEFKNLLSLEAKKRFGSGWAWLVVDQRGDLAIMSTANQDNPVSVGCVPILGLDVWEHAYYLKYQNRRVDYIEAWWHVVNWDYAQQLYAA